MYNVAVTDRVRRADMACLPYVYPSLENAFSQLVSVKELFCPRPSFLEVPETRAHLQVID